ncbi:MAG TPA: nuclear transport factor 2 family protein [Acidimicrobiales bacterium]|nr:nuclear transport factor 2 family protein [Acidimicrobiales bacterium]
MINPAGSLVNEQVIAAIVADLADAFDSGDARQFGELLRYARWRLIATGAEFVGTRGAEALASRSVRLYDGLPRTQHDVSNLLIEVAPSGDKATARSEFAVLQATEDLPLQFILAGHYEDAFALVEERWRLTSRDEHWDLIGRLDQHLAVVPGCETVGKGR